MNITIATGFDVTKRKETHSEFTLTPEQAEKIIREQILNKLDYHQRTALMARYGCQGVDVTP